jgi:hypothetical protein
MCFNYEFHGYQRIFKNHEPFYLSAIFYRVWQEVPVLVIVSMLAYFCFLEQLLVRITILYSNLQFFLMIFLLDYCTKYLLLLLKISKNNLKIIEYQNRL